MDLAEDSFELSNHCEDERKMRWYKVQIISDGLLAINMKPRTRMGHAKTIPEPIITPYNRAQPS